MGAFNLHVPRLSEFLHFFSRCCICGSSEADAAEAEEVYPPVEAPRARSTVHSRIRQENVAMADRDSQLVAHYLENGLYPINDLQFPNLQATIDELNKCILLCCKLNRGRDQATLNLQLAQCYLHRGDYVEALTRANMALDSFEVLNEEWGQTMALGLSAVAIYERTRAVEQNNDDPSNASARYFIGGQYQNAEAAASKALERLRGNEPIILQAWIHFACGLVALGTRRNREEARKNLETAAILFSSEALDNYAALCWIVTARHRGEGNGPKIAQRILDEQAKHVEMFAPRVQAELYLTQGYLDKYEDRPKAAQESFARAKEWAESCGAKALAEEASRCLN